MGEDDIHTMGDDLRIDLLRVARELAAARVALTLRRFDRELKYRPDQARVARGQQGGGQFADEGQGTAKKKAASTAAKIARRILPAALANPEAAAMAVGTAGLPAVAGGIALSRSAGLASVIASGGAGHIGGEGMTPILGIPFDLPVMISTPRPARTPDEQGRIEEECEEQLRNDEITCKLNSTLNAGRGGYSKKYIYATCMQQASARYAQCLYEGGPSHTTIPLFTGRKIR